VTEPRALWLDDETKAASLAPDVRGGTVVVTGNFDGVHRGHQALFARARAEADTRHLVPVALTFDPHPRAVLGTGAPALLTSTARRVQLIERLGVTHVFVRRFDRALAAWSPERFVEELLVDDLRARVVIAGDNFRFGAKRTGDDTLLRALGPKLGFEAFTLEATDAKGPLSSSRARDAILAGDVAEGAHVLGRPHSIEGVVEEGHRRGRTIGFPTANLGQVTELVPANGVYAVAVDRVDDGEPRGLATGVMNIGVRPTLAGDSQRTLEAHLFDFDGDLYGRTLRVHFMARLRDERKFDGMDALKAQIARDADAARAATREMRPDAAHGAYA
jgi:riboflavin kinase/FMN adenylyltransferase